MRTDRSVISRDQLLANRFITAFDAVQALRSNWIADRGPNSLSTPTEVQVYLNDIRLGGVETLRTIHTATIQYIRHYDGLAASARWGLDHGRGAIYISTRALVVRDTGVTPEAAPNDGPRATGNPSFEWFEYTGNDSALGPPGIPGQYQNPIIAGFYPDPSITRRGDDYYLVTSSFSYFPGVPIFHSKDLVNWTQIGSVLDRPAQLGIDTAGVSRGIFAPTLRYHDGTFYMITTAVDEGGNFIVTATDPAGPWSDPVFLGFDGIDPEIFFDDDGRAWVLNNGPPEEQPRYEGHRAIWIQEFDKAAMRMTGPRKLIVNGGVDLGKNPIWIEAPHVFKVNGWYYLICAEGGTAEQHSEVVFRSRSVTGPYEPWVRNPILTQRHLPGDRRGPVTTAGHADLVQTPAGDWWAVFLGVRPYRANYFNTGRETFLLPVTWQDGWPMILEGDETVPYVHAAPALPRQPAPRIPTQGNFTYRDEFDEPALRKDWQFLRTPRSQWHSLAAPAGALTLEARTPSIAQKLQPSFVLRRQQHIVASASTAMRYRPQREGAWGGLAAFQNEEYYYLLGVTKAEGRDVIRLEQASGQADAPGGGRRIVASVPLPAGAGAVTYLRIDAKGERYDFYYATQRDAWILLAAGLDGTVLSTQRAGGFVGAMFGLYAHAPGN